MRAQFHGTQQKAGNVIAKPDNALVERIAMAFDAARIRDRIHMLGIARAHRRLGPRLGRAMARVMAFAARGMGSSRRGLGRRNGFVR